MGVFYFRYLEAKLESGGVFESFCYLVIAEPLILWGYQTQREGFLECSWESLGQHFRKPHEKNHCSTVFIDQFICHG